MLFTKTYFTPGDTYRFKVRGWKKTFHANGNQKKEKEIKIKIRISDKIDFQIKTVTRDKEGPYIVIKGSIQELIIKNIYVSNIEVLQYIMQMLTAIKGKINSDTVIVRAFNTPLTSMDRSFRRKVNKET